MQGHRLYGDVGSGGFKYGTHLPVPEIIRELGAEERTFSVLQEVCL
jgi:hypothetical protein